MPEGEESRDSDGKKRMDVNLVLIRDMIEAFCDGDEEEYDTTETEKDDMYYETMPEYDEAMYDETMPEYDEAMYDEATYDENMYDEAMYDEDMTPRGEDSMWTQGEEMWDSMWSESEKAMAERE